MKNKTMLKVVFLSLVLSSCGLIERFKTPEQPTDSKDAAVAETSSHEADSTDDLFSKTMDETSSPAATDSPSNITTVDDSELKSLQDEFSPSGPNDTQIKESQIAVDPSTNDHSQEAPVLVEEALPEIKTEVEPATYSEAGQIKSYKVQRGETLMQIAFKLYGDISKWKDIKNMNSDKLTNNSSLKANTELKYRAPASPFVWNPAGTPYMIKTGETLGTISNAVYATPKKWKTIWENNKPLIKNPNVIYAGFTLYYTNGGMANYVQPKAAQPKKEIVARELARGAASREGIVEEVLVEEAIAPKEAAIPTQQTITDTQTLTANDETQVDEAIQTLSATKRDNIAKAVEKTVQAPKETEIDLINNISVPHEQEIAPDIDEEIQTL
ncbi:LysM peptidoglycan-binding domain-containing protein [Bacteriovorax sp. PP10]|uniref:LysM peptidoglycan-binding domain-containing protein n=1 Tax=Bacteriovorax antarcticus TaxID=3088717 RepID=A0ABU5VR94_9BACT|nr:LysM peptidoglycan-binding domain-containing protein [Bacteriovorax sp. PP10]MEA9355567.1 LysM peptidoglycan-binding domain-containing protein [Bacteriovorax sp. PP10]